MTRNFMDLVRGRWEKGLFSCVGLDTDIDKIPEDFLPDSGSSARVLQYNKRIIDATGDLCAAYKPNFAFYAKMGIVGLRALRETIDYIIETSPEVPIILDAKRADIGNTNAGYVEEAFNCYGADAVTANPYFGQEAMQPFLDQEDKGIIVLCRTSNTGAGELQDLPVELSRKELGKTFGAKIGSSLFPDQTGRGTYKMPLYQVVAGRVANHWNRNRNCWLVVGATAPEELARVRELVPDIPLLIPGVWSQGGEAAEVVPRAKDRNGQGFLINVSRGIIFAASPRQALETLNAEISAAL